MEERRQAQKPSAIPRVSRLPLPRSSTVASLRPSPSREQLSGGQMHNPKLRSVPSRDRLASAQPSGLRKKETVPQPQAPLSRLQTNVSQKPPASSIRKPSTRAAGNGANGRPSETPTTAPPPGPVPDKRSLTLSRRPSEVFNIDSPTTPAKEPIDYTWSPTISVPPESPITPGAEPAPFPVIKTPNTKPRPSLSERTIETLSQLPSSPAVRGKSSAFFDSTRRSSSRPASRSSRGGSRPGSSYQSDVSNRPISRGHSRPGSSSGHGDFTMMPFRSSTNTFKPPLAPINGTPSSQNRPPGSKTLRAPASRDTLRSSARKIPTPASKMIPPRSRTPSPEKRADLATENKRPVAKTLAARPLRPRPSLNGLFKKPSVSALDKPAAATALAPRKVSVVSQKSSTASSGDDTNASGASPTSTVLTTDSAESPSAATSRKSSAALREQIAKAKAAKRAATARQSEGLPPLPAPQKSPLIPTDTTFDFGLSDNPFGQRRDDNSTEKVIEARLATARSSGRLNIAALNLREIPLQILKMYDLASVGTQDGSWAESVDITRFVAADNELEMIDDSIFPDCDPQELANDEDGPGNIFGGLETLDLHGNMLISLPTGLRRLSHLSSLNMSANRITNGSLELMSQITSLRDLKLGGNLFYGPLDRSIGSLVNLEIVDLHGNNITALPDAIANLSKLRILNLNENSFETLRFDLLSKLPLVELSARKNTLSGVLIDDSVESLDHMQVLDVSSNQLKSIINVPSDGKRTISMPALHQLCLSMNRLQELPDLSMCPGLVTLAADENSIGAIPEGLITLDKLRHVDFSSNDIRVIPPEISRMDNLAMLRLSGNPLRDKKFCSITTEEMKDILAVRLVPEPEPEPELLPVEPMPNANGGGLPSTAASEADRQRRTRAESSADYDSDDFATPPTSVPNSPARSRSHTLSNQTWPVKAGGVLDRSSTQSSSLHPVVCARVSSQNRVRQVQLHHNLFSALPESLSFFAETLTSLSLAHCQLVGESYMGASGGVKLELPALTELNLSTNHITSLAPLMACLVSPKLQKLDVSVNRIPALPGAGNNSGNGTSPSSSPSTASPPTSLRDTFPQLTVLLIANNHLVDLDPESVRGLRVVDAGNNDIAHLNPRLGLLGGSAGLERLEVMGNRFRVPRYSVLERGTEATLRWLRGRVPAAEMAQWKASRKSAGEGGGGGDLGGSDDQDNDGFD